MLICSYPGMVAGLGTWLFELPSARSVRQNSKANQARGTSAGDIEKRSIGTTPHSIGCHRKRGPTKLGRL